MNFRLRRLFLRIPLVLTMAAAVASAQQLPDAAQIAGNIGKNVRFEDTVKAVSKARTHDGMYLSFGAPYPKQVLTVWVSSAVFDTLPGKDALIDRRVRIGGVLQKTDTGPMLGLEALDQFELLPANESIVSKMRIDGKTQRNQFNAAIRQYLEREDFDTLETLSRELHQSKERFADGDWLLDAFFQSFRLASDDPNELYSKRAQIILDWRAHYPTSVLPTLIDAAYHINLAWKWRGTISNKPVNEEGSQNFKRELVETRHLLETNSQAKVSPDYYSKMLVVALGQHWSKEQYFRLFAEAVSREPDYYRFYVLAAHYLLPGRYGAKGDWERFAEEQRQKRGGTDGDIVYARIAWSVDNEYPYRHHLFDKSTISWETMAAGFTALMQQHPDSRFLKNVYAHFAWEARDRSRLQPALSAIRDKPDMEVWVNLENVQMAEKFANNEPPTVSR